MRASGIRYVHVHPLLGLGFKNKQPPAPQPRVDRDGRHVWGCAHCVLATIPIAQYFLIITFVFAKYPKLSRKRDDVYIYSRVRVNYG